MLGSHFILNNGNTHNGLIFDPKGRSEPPKPALYYLLTDYRDLKLCQNMVNLHLVMSIYSIETMLDSRSIFYYGNTHNGLIFDPKGCSELHKTACLHLLVACLDLKLRQSMVGLPSVLSIKTYI